MAADAVRSPPDAPGRETGLAKGASIGRYVVLGLLGRGGMGEVYAAYDPELDRKIAIKLLRAGGASLENASQGSTRLLREAQAIARLSHPNVVVVYDVGTFEGAVFVAMEFVEGNTVGYWLQAGARGWREVLGVFLAAGRGLVAAHEAGIIHRDFKPDNVMITKDGQVRVMDFGLARQVLGEDEPPPSSDGGAAEAVVRALLESFDGELDPDATANLEKRGAERPSTSSGGYLRLKLTQTGAILGTPAYMAPEQFGGKRGDARADQFSFCVALYEGIYGRRPFAGDNIVALMASVVGGVVGAPPPDARVPAWIRKVLLRGLRAEPDERYPSMAALLAALGHDPAARRRRFLAAGAGAMLVATLAAGAHRLTAGQRALCAGAPERVSAVWGPRQRGVVRDAFAAAARGRAEQAFAGVGALVDRYVEGWSAMYREACEATHVRGEQSADVLDLRMSCLGERLGSARALIDVFEHANAGVVDNAVGAASALPGIDRCADVAMLRAVVRPPDDPATRARVSAVREQVAKVEALGRSGQCEQATAAGRSAVEAATAVGYLPLQAEALYQAGRLGDNCTEASRAIEQLERASFAAEASNHEEIAIAASVYLGFINADRAHDARMGRFWTRHGEAILARFPGHPRLAAWVAGAEANALFGEGRFEEGVKAERRALALKETALGPFHVDDAISLMNLAVALHELGRDDEARPTIERAIAIFTKLLGEDSAQLATALLDQTEILTAVHEYKDARVAIDRALAIWSGRGAGQFFTGYGLLDLGRLQLAEDHPQLARVTLERAGELLGKSDAQIAAEAQFELARAMWGTARERRAAVTGARAARHAIGEGPGQARKRAAIDEWLREHDTP